MVKTGLSMLLLLSAFLLGTSASRADVTLLLEEQIGSFWRMNPDHSAIYFSRVCVESLTSLRRCAPGEQGAVISRYHRIDGYDWIAIPLTPYLYAVEHADQVAPTVTPEEVAELRKAYRRSHLEEIAPEQSNRSKDWPQLIGEAYDRTIYGFRIQTTSEQDDELIRTLNARPNRNQFNIVLRNCADFAAQIINFYYPNTVHRNLADLGIMTPGRIAKSLVHYAQRHPKLAFSVFEIAQVPGAAPRSKAIYGVLSSKHVLSVPCAGPPAIPLPTLTCPPR